MCQVGLENHSKMVSILHGVETLIHFKWRRNAYFPFLLPLSSQATVVPNLFYTSPRVIHILTLSNRASIYPP